MRRRRRFGRLVLSAWVLGIGFVQFWRGLILWRQRRLLWQLESTLSVVALPILVSFLSGIGLVLMASAIGLIWRREWARQTARIGIPAAFVLVQVYIWGFVRSGLLWDRRWAALALAVGASVVGVGALTWRKARQWLDLSF